MAQCLARLVAVRQPHEFLFPVSYPELSTALHDAAAALGAEVLQPTLHGLRHGGPSHDFAVNARDMAEIQSRGKWKAASSVRRYERHARIGLQLSRLGENVRARLLSEEKGLGRDFVLNFLQPSVQRPARVAVSTSSSSRALVEWREVSAAAACPPLRSMPKRARTMTS